MTDDSDTETEAILPEPLRTVTPPYRGRPDREMDVFGYLLFGLMLVILIPFGPFILLAWLFGKLTSRF